MKKLIAILFLFASFKINAQSICVSADCTDTMKYPATSISLNGVVNSGEGVKSLKWTSVPGTIIANPLVAVTSASGFTTTGWYVFTLSAVSNKNATGVAFDSVWYVANQPPKAITSGTVAVTTNTVTLYGAGSSDPEGQALAFKWSQTSGPNTSVIALPTTASPVVTGLVNGTYVYQLSITDPAGLSSTATETVNVSIAVTQIKTMIVTTVVATKYFSNGTTTSSTTSNTVTTVP